MDKRFWVNKYAVSAGLNNILIYSGVTNEAVLLEFARDNERDWVKLLPNVGTKRKHELLKLYDKLKPMGVRLYVDDLRPCPKGWDVARNFHEAIVMLESKEYYEVSLDHDIASFYGNKEMTGRDILNWLIARKLDGKPSPEIVRVHSANPVGCATMEEDIKRYWGTP